MLKVLLHQLLSLPVPIFIDVSKLSPAYVDMAILKDSLRHKMAM